MASARRRARASNRRSGYRNLYARHRNKGHDGENSGKKRRWWEICCVACGKAPFKVTDITKTAICPKQACKRPHPTPSKGYWTAQAGDSR